jgi:hypothetical protein
MGRNRACDACRRRKVKCDEADHCSSCRISQLPCERRLIPRQRGPRVAKRPECAQSPDTGLQPNGSPGRHAGRDISGQKITSAEEQLQRTSLAFQHHYPATGSSPVSVSSSVATTSTASSVSDASQIYNQLVYTINSMVDVGTIEDVVCQCVDLYLRYMFPIAPIVHEPTLRADASLFSNHESAAVAFAQISTPVFHQPPLLMKRFTSITAICASVITMIPSSLFPVPKALSVPFLHASKAMLRCYEEYDLEYPDASSLISRILYSGVALSSTGRVGASWHYHAEAACLAQRLRLYSERSVVGKSPVESKTLRNLFWLLYLGEQTQLALDTRPPVIDERLFDGGLTLLEDGKDTTPLLDPNRKFNHKSLETRLLVGFHLRRKIWTRAAILVRNIKMHSPRNNDDVVDMDTQATNIPSVTSLVDLYLNFTDLATLIPDWLRQPDSATDLSADDDVRNYQKTCFWVQRGNIMSIYHCMKLVILQACIDHNLPAVVGLNDSPLSWANRKLEIVQAFQQDLQVVPFDCLRVHGETAVSAFETNDYGTVEANLENPLATRRWTKFDASVPFC